MMHPNIKKARRQMMLDDPFYALIAMNWRYVADETQESCAVDGKSFFYNPKWAEETEIPYILPRS